jgi:hypothetical protein
MEDKRKLIIKLQDMVKKTIENKSGAIASTEYNK